MKEREPRRPRDNKQRRDKTKDTAPRILERRPTQEPKVLAINNTVNTQDCRPGPAPQSQLPPQSSIQEKTKSDSPPTGTVPFYRRQDQFQMEAVMKVLTDHPGHFVVGVVGQQGVGKSTILSAFTDRPAEAFPTQSNDLFLAHGHKTLGIDMYACPERVLLLDTEPLLCWTVLEKALQHTSLQGTSPDAWLEMDSLYQLVFLLSVCNVVLVVMEGTDVDMDMLQCLRRAELLKFRIPDFPLLNTNMFGPHDMNYYPDIMFVCNKCQESEWTRSNYLQVQSMLDQTFQDTQMKIKGTGSLASVLPGFNTAEAVVSPLNLYFLPWKHQTQMESFEVLVQSLRDMVMAAPRRRGRKNHLSEKEWFKNAVKVYDMVRRSEYIRDYTKSIRKLRDP
ncbi:hypothetical protein DM01DRAFT_1340349 [Hesseltinella vesiculosa]|uniref:Protein SMG9 n=1 Tax=Hesseltinella vesiculosa TaxID=101127 RepID=A0A1X2G4C7_9FUNG|nr:hypothetical protein DM01DRAFT_1340349 [Hesseltinella vesiculosa]